MRHHLTSQSETIQLVHDSLQALFLLLQGSTTGSHRIVFGKITGCGLRNIISRQAETRDESFLHIAPNSPQKVVIDDARNVVNYSLEKQIQLYY